MRALPSRRQRVAAAACAGLAWLAFGLLRFDQGLDLSGQGIWVYGASLESSGRAVHALLDTGDGPLRYQLLAAWMRLDHVSFLAAAHLQAVLHTLLATLLMVWGMRRGLAVALLLQLTLLAAVPLGFAALWAGLTLCLAALCAARWRSLLVGLLLAGLATLDGLWFLLAAATIVASMDPASRRDGLRRGALAMVGGLVLTGLVGLLSGAPGSTLHNSFIGPWSTSLEGFRRITTALINGAWLDRPFAGLGTGEALGAAWPGHAISRTWSLRVAALVVLAMPLLATRHGERWRAGIALSSAALLLCFLRGDLPTLALALILSVAAMPLAIDRRMLARVLPAAIVLAAITGASENGWLVINSGRDGLVRSPDPRIGVRMAQARVTSMQSAVSRLHLHDGRAALIWPDLSGLHFLLGSHPVVPATRPGSSDDAGLAAALAAPAAPAVLLAAARELLPQHLESSLPQAAAVLRRDYRLRGSVPAGGLNLRVIERGARPNDPLTARLPRVQSIVAQELQELGPALRDDLAIGQSFRLQGDDLAGFAIRLVTTADSVQVTLRARLWERRGSRYDSLLEARTMEFVASRDIPMHWFRYEVQDSADRDLALVFESVGTPAAEVRFAWNENAREGGAGDIYEQGSAMLDLEPVDADLIVLIY